MGREVAALGAGAGAGAGARGGLGGVPPLRVAHGLLQQVDGVAVAVQALAVQLQVLGHVQRVAELLALGPQGEAGDDRVLGRALQGADPTPQLLLVAALPLEVLLVRRVVRGPGRQQQAPDGSLGLGLGLGFSSGRRAGAGLGPQHVLPLLRGGAGLLLL